MSKISVLFVSAVIVVTSGIQLINCADAQMHTRYSLECGLPKDVPADLWAEYTLKQYDYDTEKMPQDVKDQYLCYIGIKYGLN